MRKYIVIVAYEFYPLNTGGTHRPFRMAKFLKKNGYEPIVITADDAAFEGNYDSSLQSTLDREGIEVVRVGVQKRNIFSDLSDRYYFNVTDDTWKRWKGNLIPALDRIIASKRISCVILTVPPFSLVNITSCLQRRNLPVILDMRDAWSQWNVAPYASKLHYWLTLRKEREAIRHADLTLLTSPVTLGDLKELHGEVLSRRLVYVPNSFDKLDMEPAPPRSAKVDIGYVGSFYYDPQRDYLNNSPWWKKRPWQWLQYLPHREEWIYRSPYFIFKTVAMLFKQYSGYADKVNLHFAGVKPPWFDRMVEEFSLQATVIHHGFLNKLDGDALQRRMHYMLITSAKRHNKKDYSIAGKTYELMAMGKPVLAFVTDSAQKDILEGTGTATIFDVGNLEASVHQLKQVIDGSITVTPDVEYLNRYSTDNTLRPVLEFIRKCDGS